MKILIASIVFFFAPFANWAQMQVDFTPKSGPAGTHVTVSVGNVGFWPTYFSVSFSGINAQVLDWTWQNCGNGCASINVIAPQGAMNDIIAVAVSNGSSSTSAASSSIYTFGPTPTIASFSPAGGPAGTQITINGTNFVAPVSFKIGGAAGTITSYSSTQIVGTVPFPVSSFWGQSQLVVTNAYDTSPTAAVLWQYPKATATSVSLLGDGTMTINGTNLQYNAVVGITDSNGIDPIYHTYFNPSNYWPATVNSYDPNGTWINVNQPSNLPCGNLFAAVNNAYFPFFINGSPPRSEYSSAFHRIVKATINSPNGLNVCSGNVVLTASDFYANPPSTHSYSWSDGETTQSIYPSMVATYTVTVTNDCGSSSTASVTTSSIPHACGSRIAAPDVVTNTESEGPDVAEATASPNPSNQEATIAVPTIEKVDRQVLIYDMLGKTVGTATLKKGEWKTSVSTKELVEGLYIINVSYGGWVNTTKMMVIHK